MVTFEIIDDRGRGRDDLDTGYSMEVLAKREELENKNLQVLELKSRVQMMETQHEYNLKFEARRHEEMVKTKELEMKSKLDRERERSVSLVEEVGESWKDQEGKFLTLTLTRTLTGGG